ncbi:hypothetical protein [Agromyces bauzanensis]
MTRLDAHAANDLPITTDRDIEQRVADLLQGAHRRQWWTLYLDDADVQQPVLMPMAGYPDDPDAPVGAEGTVARVLANRLAEIVESIGAAKVVFVWERSGGASVTAADRAWASALGAACRNAGVAVRAQLVLHDRGVRWLAPDDLA